MALTTVKLKVSEEVSGNETVADTYTPANGAEVYIDNFDGDAAFSTNAVVKVIWDYDGTQEILWSIKGSRSVKIDEFRTGDGTKKIAVECDNGESGALFMSGSVCLRVKS